MIHLCSNLEQSQSMSGIYYSYFVMWVVFEFLPVTAPLHRRIDGLNDGSKPDEMLFIPVQPTIFLESNVESSRGIRVVLAA